MAHYSYKTVAYDIDFSKWQQLEKQFEKEYGYAPDGDPNYAGDNWILAKMWIRELLEENEMLKRRIRHKIRTNN